MCIRDSLADQPVLEQSQPHAAMLGGDLRQPEAEGPGQPPLLFESGQQCSEVVVEERALQWLSLIHI